MLVAVTTQAQWDKAVKAGQNIKVTSGPWYAYDSARVDAYDSARVDAHDSAVVDAHGSARVDAYDSARVDACQNAVIVSHSDNTQCQGIVINTKQIHSTPQSWLATYHIPIKQGLVILYKTVATDFSTRHAIKYLPGTTVIAPDWSEENIECGNGLHFSPCSMAAEQFRDSKKYVACQVKVADIRTYQGYPQYVDKIRAKQCKVLYECDRDGNPIKEVIK